MVEIIEAGSPDSGYISHSPLSCVLDRHCDENGSLKVGKSVKIASGSTRKVVECEQSSGDDITPSVNVHSLSTPGKYGGKLEASCNNQAGESVSLVTNNKLLNSVKRAARKRRHGNRATKDEENVSPVLGIKILPMDFVNPINLHMKSLKSETTKEKCKETNKEVLGSGKFICRLCAKDHANAVELAQHQCPRIVNVRYDCSECGKSFGCPANLASHKRWHKPKVIVGDTMVNPENKRRKLSVSPTSELCKTVAISTGIGPRNSASPSSIASEEDRSTPSPNVRVKAIYACPACKRRFRRESNRRKHALVKHDIVMPMEKKPTKQAAAPSVKCSLATLAMAAESLNKTAMIMDVAQNNRAMKNTPETGTQPLDLTTKPAAAPSAPLRHGVDQILSLAANSKNLLSSPFATISSTDSASLKHAILSGSNAFVPRAAVAQSPQMFPAQSFQQWPFTAQPFFADYRYLAAMAAERMLTCAYRL